MRERMRFAAFGGVYSNDVALEAVCTDLARLSPDAVWCLGDLGGFGPHPDRSIDRLRASGIPVLQGNYDASIGHDHDDCACGYTDPLDNHFAQVSFDYTRARTSPHHKAWMRDLPVMHRFEAAGRRVLLCHGSPRRANEFLWASTCSNDFLEWLCDTYAADLLLCTHTGLHWHRALPSGRHVVNVGAIGRPANDGTPRVWYAAVEWNAQDVDVSFRALDYDHQRLALDMEHEGLPPEFIETIRTGWWTTCLENMPSRERMRGRH
jgi:diadenosine tetraphosphatase ApaH/serine/threonine PP2A family protein phosphatase